MDNYNNYNSDDGQQNNQQQGNDYGQPAGSYNYGGPQMNDGTQPQYGYNMQMAPQEQKGQSIASFVLGIVSLLAWCIPLLGYPVTIVGIIMGALGMKKGGRGLAIAGIIMSVLGLIATLVNTVLGAMMMMGRMGY